MQLGSLNVICLQHSTCGAGGGADLQEGFGSGGTGVQQGFGGGGAGVQQAFGGGGAGVQHCFGVGGAELQQGFFGGATVLHEPVVFNEPELLHFLTFLKCVVDGTTMTGFLGEKQLGFLQPHSFNLDPPLCRCLDNDDDVVKRLK